ncbi:MAG TPA: Nudix family hydrolase [Gammaproteobacteria bacterium]|jgi:8-oxo-dGTP diphosphatase
MRNIAAESCRCGGRLAARRAPRGPGAEPLQIAVGVICDASGDRVLLARRRPGTQHAGLWEFPGGKCRPGERFEDALRRELLEETDVAVESVEPLVCIDHAYPQVAVRLHVWRIARWHGAARGREGQEVEWVPVGELRRRTFPEANRAIVSALTLPALYVITPDIDAYDADFLALASSVLGAGAKLIQFRSTRLAEPERARILARLVELCGTTGARLMVNGSITEVLGSGARGMHLTSSRLLQANERPLDPGHLIGASCHNRMELEHAERLGLDFAVLGPVRRTRTHPDVEPLGWRRFRNLAGRAGLPVYALGGITPADLETARRNGAHGLAMIGGIWSAEDPAAAVAACVRFFPQSLRD